MINTSTKRDMQLNVFFQKSNTLEDYFLDLINQLVTSLLFYHLLGLVYGYVKNSTEPRDKISQLPEELEADLKEHILNGPSGRSLLHNALTQREVIQLLRGFYIDPLVCTKEGETPLMTFIRDGKRALAFAYSDYLKLAGMPLDQKDTYGTTALDLAVLFGDKELENALNIRACLKTKSF